MSDDEFWLAKDVIPLAIITNSYIKSFAEAKPSAKLSDKPEDLAAYVLIECTHIYTTFFDFSDVKNDVHVFATIARSAQETCFDYLYAVNHKNADKKIRSLLWTHRHGAIDYGTYFDFMKGLADEKEMHISPRWTNASQMQRIRKHGGFEEMAFYSVLCSLAHHSIPNERFIQHPNEVLILRGYLLAKIIKYNYLLAKSCLDNVDIKNTSLKTALKNFVNQIDDAVDSWDVLLAGTYGLRDHDDHQHGDLASRK